MVFVIDKHKKPLMPCSEKRARKLLDSGRAVVHKYAPFVIRIKDRLQKDSELQDVRIKIDPGSKVDGISAINEDTNEVIMLGELADSSVNFNVRPWVESGDYWDVMADVTEKIKLAFDDAGISIPYPQMDVHVATLEGTKSGGQPAAA